ncbi:hypothetical protein Osc1_05190 [Hominimerdicola sp. 21CYCFAH17_S]
MNLQDEMRIAKERGLEFIPPYRLAEIMKLSQRVIKLLTDNTTAVTLSYSDMKTVMEIVNDVINKGVGN